MARALITGICGFIGSHLADYLIETGHEVAGMDDLSTGDMKNVPEQVRFYPGDIRHRGVMQEIVERSKPDWVFHLAANCRTQLSVENPSMNNDVNITGTLSTLLAARDHGVKRFIFASSCIIYAPNTPYYVSKLAGEEYCRVFNKIYSLPTISLRYSNVYGSLRQSEKGFHINAIASLRKSKRDTGRIWITGDGTQRRDWTHVKDIARANVLAAVSDEVGVFDICTGVQTSMNDVAAYFNCPIDHVEPRPGDAPILGPQNPKPAREKLGYVYSISLNKESLQPYL